MAQAVAARGYLGRGFLDYEAAHPTSSVAIGGLVVCTGEVPTFDDLGALLTMAVTVMPELASMGGPDTDDFDWRRHLFEIHAEADSGETGLGEAVDTIVNTPLGDVPWAVWLVRGYAPETFALVLRGHHATFDGVSLVTVVSRVLGGSSARPATAEPAPDRGWSWARLAAASGELASLPGGIRRVAGFLPADVPLTGRLHHVWAATSWRRLRTIAGAYGASPNDVYLAGVAGALRAWHPDPLWPAGRVVKAQVPVDRRRRDNREELGNHVIGVRVPLPCATTTPQGRLTEIRDSTRWIATARRQRTLGGLLDLMPDRLSRLVLELGLKPRSTTLITTQVPGPARPLSVFGRRVTEMRPLMFLPAGHRLGVCLADYAGRASVGFVADRSLTRIEELAEAFLGELDALEATIGS